MSWIGSYQDALRELGVAEEDVSFPAQPGRGSAMLMATYTHRMKASLTTWYTNILVVGHPGGGLLVGKRGGRG